MNYGHGYDADNTLQPAQSCLSRILPILVMATVAFWFTSRVRQQDQPQNRGPHEVQPSGQLPGSVKIQPGPLGEKPNDWSIEQVESTPRADSNSTVTESTPTATSEGDWTIEEVESKNKASNGQPVEQIDVNDPQSTEKGDWMIEEVEAGPPK